ncbi:hydantoinase/oxoprolinase family protein [Aquamicrobium sp. LC103]|uniref:hydantoinase/oxoprolinase family protein n=1 Tax=Aquamicrobium sp. LC103 TaxID=1120658 RepID=UPI00063E7F25|nr:hydantoinase/oxoprolinase family protein [Aquamicrobium sp. LC103]TKT75880.1 hydantoinase/oxoprolinase family protein [Aquamicrobium sp. LC103]
MTAATRGARIGIDVGGTFTDFVLSDPRDRSLSFYKEPSTPDDPSRALIDGLQALLDQVGLGPRDVSVLMHGTTIGLNAIIQRKGARIGLIVSSGYRDILEIARCRMPSSFDFHADKEIPLVPRERIIEIGARLSASGAVTARPDEMEISRVTAELQALKLDAAALVLINGYTHPDFESELAERISSQAGGLAITSAASIWPEIREYERTLVACLNAYIQPLIQHYFDGLRGGLTERGVTAPIVVTASNGGSLSAASAVDRPVETILSGPASGVMAAVRLAQAVDTPGIITFDMGGTSSDIAIAAGGMPELATRTDIGGLPLVLPVVDVSAIGAGGGSIVWVDQHGIIKVGPQSAGAKPGPVSYGQGGDQPAVTDCYLTLGYIDPAGFLGGRMKLDGDAARAALASVGTRIGLSGNVADVAARAAEGALAVTTAGMASALYKTLAERGLDPRGFALVPFGGAGPTHANLLAEEVGIPHIIVPPAAGTFCAMGAAGADLRRDFVRSLRLALDAGSSATLSETFEALRTEGLSWLAAEGGAKGETRFDRAVDMRYAGQAYELRVNLPADATTADAIAEAFHREHERIYGFRDTEAVVELGTARLAAVGITPDLPVPDLYAGGTAVGPKGERPIYHRGTWIPAAVYSRAALVASQSLAGPAIVEQEDTTVVILPGWSGRIDRMGNLHLEGIAK